MGKYLNPGCNNYEEALNSDIYVDKTEMIAYVNSVVKTKQKYMCVSRPRRFGKTMAADMLCAYYGKGESRQLFVDRKLAGNRNWDKYINHFDVVRVIMSDFIKKDSDISGSLLKMQKLVVRDLKKQYQDVDYYDVEDIKQSMSDVYEETGKQFVIIIDEWDVVFRVCKEDKDGQKLYLDFLRDWLKDQEYVALAYMTGILPIKKYGQHSALNMFDEYSIIAPMQLAKYTGFTEEEVKLLCEEYGRNFNNIKEWYDGYEANDIIPPDPNYEVQKETGKEKESNRYSIYSPLSVVKAIRNGLIQNYWNKTENYEALAEYIRMNYDGLKDSVALMMDGGSVKVDIGTYQNDMNTFNSKDDVLALLINLGYLKYDCATQDVAIPNKEILDEFKNSTKSEEWTDTFISFRKSQELVDATWNRNEDKVAELLEWFHDSVENKTYNSEAALSYAVQLAYYAGQKYYTTIQELDSGKGRWMSCGHPFSADRSGAETADLVYLPSPRYPDKPALLIELKYDKTIETAADQIRRKNYPQKLEHYKGNILLISVNYEKELDSTDAMYKHHSCRIALK